MKLSPQQIKILDFLIKSKNPSKIDEIFNILYESEYEPFMGKRIIYTHIDHLRKKFKYKVIINIKGKGYKINEKYLDIVKNLIIGSKKNYYPIRMNHISNKIWFTIVEEKIFAMLCEGKVRTKENIIKTLYYNKPECDWPDCKMITSYITRLRKKVPDIRISGKSGYKIIDMYLERAKNILHQYRIQTYGEDYKDHYKF